MDIVLVHGYNVTSTKTYGSLPKRLKDQGHRIKNVFLSKYVTLDNDLTFDDLVRGFDAALQDVFGENFNKKSFACLTHSTGGLVVRAWIASCHKRKRAIPISHLIMLAPPNHGSRLASLGKSRLSRLRSLWGVEPGLKILNGLELGSLFQWELDEYWRENKIHQLSGFYPVVMSGQWIDKKIWDVVVPATYERGSDGVVRAAAANLNTRWFSIDVSEKVHSEMMEGIPFYIPEKAAHSDSPYGIMASAGSSKNTPVFKAINDILNVSTRAEYNRLRFQFSQQTEEVQKKEMFYDKSALARYSQLIVRIQDNRGNDLSDYAVEFLDKDGRGDKFPAGFLAHIHKNQIHPSLLTHYFNYDQAVKVVGGILGIKIESVGESELVKYPPVICTSIPVRELLQPNQTTYLHVKMTRQLNKNVFRLTKDFSAQKIKRNPGPEWIS